MCFIAQQRCDRGAANMDERKQATDSNHEVDRDESLNMEESMAFVALEDVHPGQIVEGTVVHISPDSVLVDVGGKSDGIIHLNDLTHRKIDRPEEVVQLGDVIRVFVVGYEGEEGSLKLSKRRADEVEAWTRLENLQSSGEVIEAPVVEVVKGGLVVDVGMRGFIPASHVARGYVAELDGFLGQTVPVRVIELDRSKRRVILSRKIAMEEQTKQRRDQVWNAISEGQVITGTVKSLTDFGAFVDLGGVDGLLHISEMSWGRITHPSEVLEVGQEVSVKILRLDPERNKISLGLRQVSPNPWETIAERYAEGQLYQGKVVRIAAFGAFVELEPGVDGLVHISQLAAHRIGTPADVVSVGDTVTVKVLHVDPEHKKISLSKKEADEMAESGIEPLKEVLEDDALNPMSQHLTAYHAGDWDDEDPNKKPS